MKEKISLLLIAIGLLMIGIGIGGCASENINNTVDAGINNDWESKRVRHDLVEVIDPETGVHYLLHDTGYRDGGTAITVMYDSDGRIKCDE